MIQNDDETGELFEDAPAILPAPDKPPRRKPGFPKGRYTKMPGSGRKAGVPNKKPGFAKVILDRAAPEAARMAVAVMHGRRIPHKDGWWDPEPHQRMWALRWILERTVPALPSGQAGQPQVVVPMQVNIVLEAASGAAPKAITIDATPEAVE